MVDHRPVNPVIEMPLTIYFWKRKKTVMIGTVIIVE
jgi:hypothetical protein